jgi:hypothetical protein
MFEKSRAFRNRALYSIGIMPAFLLSSGSSRERGQKEEQVKKREF